MDFYYAPMEGVTGCAYRRVHARMFPGADRYFAPFIAPDGSGGFKLAMLRDLLPENNPQGLPTPQLLCNRAEPFLAAARVLAELGYDRVNLNVGCPSSTVVGKHKGAGMLLDLESLDRCLEEIFSRCPIAVSVKTRMGLASVSEFPAILEVYNKYPLAELIIHARDRAGMYKSLPDQAAFRAALPLCRCGVCYNGNIFAPSDLEGLPGEDQGLRAVMIGRGAAANPALFRRLKGGKAPELKELRDFHEALLEEYLSSGLDGRCAMARLKELWYYMQDMFPQSAGAMKAVYKSQRLSDYRSAVASLFAGGGFSPEGRFRG